MREFASIYQIMIREELSIYLIMAGLYKNIQDLENNENLTFLYRTPKLEMKPLNMTLIRNRYQTVFSIDSDKAMEMALAKCKSNEFSQYRKCLAAKGLIDISQYGSIKYTLPRFNIFVENQIE